MLPESLLQHLEFVLNTQLRPDNRATSGAIHKTHVLTSAEGRRLFVKYADKPGAAEMFRTEALGLTLLGASRALGVPRVHAHGEAPGGLAFLALDFVASGPRSRLFWENFGAALANLHGNTSAQFGFAHDNFIGSLPQSNTRHDRWADFYAAERLLPQLGLARDAGRLDAAEGRRVEKICTRIQHFCPEEAPALVHGDLWSGNFLCNEMGEAVLIDPAASFSHREMDLAMARLFGGFDPAFFQNYETAWPLEADFEERLEIYQLYYLLVHVNLFGGGYAEQVRGILRRFT